MKPITKNKTAQPTKTPHGTQRLVRRLVLLGFTPEQLRARLPNVRPDALSVAITNAKTRRATILENSFLEDEPKAARFERKAHAAHHGKRLPEDVAAEEAEKRRQAMSTMDGLLAVLDAAEMATAAKGRSGSNRR